MPAENTFLYLFFVLKRGGSVVVQSNAASNQSNKKYTSIFILYNNNSERFVFAVHWTQQCCHGLLFVASFVCLQYIFSLIRTFTVLHALVTDKTTENPPAHSVQSLRASPDQESPFGAHTHLKRIIQLLPTWCGCIKGHTAEFTVLIRIDLCGVLTSVDWKVVRLLMELLWL